MILQLLLIFIIFSIADYLLIKWEIKHNKDLFIDLHVPKKLKEKNNKKL